MTGPASGPGKGRRPRQRPGLLVAAGAALWWERLWPALWPAAAVAAAFLTVALLDLLPHLPGWLHGVVLLGFVAAFVFVLVRGFRGFRGVTLDAARRRLEHDSGLDHRPLTALRDLPADGAGNPEARALWVAHQRRMAERLRALRVGMPAPGMTRRDPRGLRALAVLGLVVALVAGGADSGPRLLRALTPPLTGGGTASASVGVWITPPAYTGMAPMYLEHDPSAPAAAPGTDGEPETPTTVVTPAGSTVLAQAAGPGEPPELIIGDSSVPFEAVGESQRGGTYRVSTTIQDGDRLAVRAGRSDLVAWPLRVLPDHPPTIAVADPPSAQPGAMLGLSFHAEDDFGVAAATAEIEAPDGPPLADGETVERLDLPLSSPGAASVDGQSAHDLAAHAWAGRSVIIRLEAVDGAGQTGRTEPIETVLPAPTFNHPVAQELIEARRHLFERRDAARRAVAAVLQGLSGKPDHFAGDVVVSLALGVSRARLLFDRRPVAVTTVIDLLWDTALRVEDGAVPVAERDLRDARQRLWEALRSDADLEEIERLMDDLEQALDRYLAAMMAELARNQTEPMPFDPSAEIIDSKDLRDLIDMAREFARSGARESARRLLTELQRALDSLRGGMQSTSPREELIEAQKLMNGLRSLAQRQQELLDQTYEHLRQLRAQRDQNPSAPQPQGPAPGADAQETLRRDLGDFMLRLNDFIGGIPMPLQRAERAMRGAGKALDSGQPGVAVPRQSEAAEHLRKATESAAEQLARRLGGLAGMFGEDPDEGDGDDTDPFGRGPGGGNGGFGTSEVEIPGRGELDRVQRIQRELRRRAGERDRLVPELRYIDRLLRPF